MGRDLNGEGAERMDRYYEEREAKEAERTAGASPPDLAIEARPPAGWGDRRRRKKSLLRYAVAWSMDPEALRLAHEFNYLAGTPFHAELHGRNFRRELGQLHYGLALNADGSSYRPVDWEDHEKELACLSLKWPATLALIISDPDSKEEQPFAAKCFRDGMVYDWTAETVPKDCPGFMDVSTGRPVMQFLHLVEPTPWPLWPKVLDSMTPRSPRPCPQPPEVEAAPA